MIDVRSVDGPVLIHLSEGFTHGKKTKNINRTVCLCRNRIIHIVVEYVFVSSTVQVKLTYTRLRFISWHPIDLEGGDNMVLRTRDGRMSGVSWTLETKPNCCFPSNRVLLVSRASRTVMGYSCLQINSLRSLRSVSNLLCTSQRFLVPFSSSSSSPHLWTSVDESLFPPTHPQTHCSRLTILV